MELIDWLLRPRAEGLDPLDDRYYTMGPGGTASSGAYVDANTALRFSPVWACVRLLSDTTAMTPIITYRRRSDGGKERAPSNPLYGVLHDEPNRLQSAFQWKRTMMVHALLWGCGYSHIVPGPRGAVDQLELTHPDRVRCERLPGGGIRYQVRGDDGIERPVNDEDMFTLPSLSLDGTTGLSLIEYARETVGLGLAAQGYSSRFYSQDARPGGVLKHKGRLSPDMAKRVKDSWAAGHAGYRRAYSVGVLEEGMEWQSIGMTNEQAQLIAQLDWSVADTCRFFNVPLHMVQQLTKSTSWGSGIEEMGIEYVVYSFMPWAANWEGMIRKKLILAPQVYFAEFLLDNLMRGKLLDRYNAYAIGRNWGWLCANDICRLENMNPIEGGDVYLQPLNMQEAGKPPTVPHPPPSPPGGGSEGSRRSQALPVGHYFWLLHEAASRVVRKEIAAMGKAARRCADDAEAWQAAVSEFYIDHAAFVQQTLGLSKAAAERYAFDQARALLEHGAGAMEDWETRQVAYLVALAMGGGEDGHAGGEGEHAVPAGVVQAAG